MIDAFTDAAALTRHSTTESGMRNACVGCPAWFQAPTLPSLPRIAVDDPSVRRCVSCPAHLQGTILFGLREVG